MKKEQCTQCTEPSIPGMLEGHGKCQYHWNAGVWGKEWADKVKADQEAVAKAQRNYLRPKEGR